MRELPCDIVAEQSVIGSILLDPQVSFPKITLSKEDFYDAKHKVLFQALRDMYIDNYTLDMITTRNYLQDKKLLDAIGGEKYLLRLQDIAIVPSHVIHYQKILKEKAALRREIKILSEALDKTYDGESNADKVISELSIPKVEDEKTLEELGEEFLDNCINNTVGSFSWWNDEWDKQLGKMDSELMLLHAPRSTGKTALMLQWILKSHCNNLRTPLASIEMLRKELLPRLIANIGQVNTHQMRTQGNPTVKQVSTSRESIQTLKKLKLCVRDKAMTIDDIRSWAISESKNGVDAIFIDNLLSISDGGKQWQSKTIMYDHFIRKFRDLRDELKVPIIILAHPTSDGTNQIAWSRDVENFADIILFIMEVPYNGVEVNGKVIMKDNLIENHSVCRFQKNRQGISLTSSVSFNKQTQTFKHIRWE